MTRGSLLPWCMLAVIGCEPDAADCANGVREAGVLCFPPQEFARVGQGFEPDALAVLDLDGDGRLDLAAANPARQTLSITWGGPGGLFTRMSSWPIGRPIAGLAHGDFDGDGRLDLAAALPDDDGVALLHNRGARRLELQTHRAGGSPRALLGVDLDNDGRAELVTANLGDGTVSVLRRGRADPPIAVGVGPRALAAGDLDGDGAPDLAVALADDDAVQVLDNSGGVLLAGARHVVGFAPRAVVIGDLDEDGALDLATADELGDTITVVLGDGAGGARETRTWPVMSQPAALAIVGGEQRPGLGVMSEQTSELFVVDPLTGAVTPGTSARWASAFAAGDLDRDGRDELVVGGRASVASALAGATGPRFVADWDAPPLGVHAAVDLDGDGHDELIVVPDELVSDLAIWRGPEDVADPTRTMTGLPHPVRGIVGADLDDDGRTDLVVWGASPDVDSGAVAALLQQQDGSFDLAGPAIDLPDFAIAELVVGRILFGAVGLVFTAQKRKPGPDSPTGLWMMLGDGHGGFGPVNPLDERDPSPWISIDLDGDAALDLVVTYNNTRTLEIHTDLFSKPPRVLQLDAPAHALAAGDVDGDGALDLLLCSERGLELVRGLAGAAATTIAVPDIACNTADLRDLDGDGDLDAMLQLFEQSLTTTVASPPTRRTLTLLRNDGAGGFTPVQRQVLAEEGASARVLARSSDGTALAFAGARRFQVLRSELGPTLLERPLSMLGQPARPDFADLDGDGLLDWFAIVGHELVAGFGAGAGAFGPAHHTTATGIVDPDVVSLHTAALADIDGDGAHEAVLLAVVDNPQLFLRAVSIVRVGADGDFHGETITRLASSSNQLLVRDLDGDDHLDILLTEQAAGELLVSRLRGHGDGSFDPVVSERIPGEFYGRQLVELDGDGLPDLLLQTPDGLASARGQAGGFDPRRPWGPPGALGLVRIRDLTGDTRPDLLLGTTDGLVLFRSTPNGFTAPRQLLSGIFLPSLAIADLDGDGAEELVVGSTARDRTSQVQIGRPLGDGRFVFTAREVPLPLTDFFYNTFGVKVTDLDDDGAPDIVLPDLRGFTVVQQTP